MSNLFFQVGEVKVYPSEVIEEVRLENDIVAVVSERVVLKRKGNAFWGLCPFHNEKTASFSVNPDKQMFYCFGCQTGGNVFSFVMKIENYDFLEAVKYLAERVNYQLPEKNLSEEARRRARFKAKLYEIQKISARFFYDALISEQGLHARNYLAERGIYPKVWTKYGLGYATDGKKETLHKFLISKGYDQESILSSGLVIKKDDGSLRDRFFCRLTFPILDVNKKVIAFGGRVIGSGEPKYLNSPETPIFSKSRNLYGLNFAKAFKAVVIVEGYMDVISLYQAGFANGAAALGTAFTDNHAELLKKYASEAVICFDSDEAGTKAALRAIPILLKSGLVVRALRLKGAKDPDEYIKKFGANAFAKELSGAESYVMYQIEEIKKKYDLTNRYQATAFANEAAETLSQMQNSIDRGAYIREVARISGSRVQDIEEEIKKLGKPDTFKLEIKKRRLKATGNLDEARRGLLYFACADYRLFQKITDVLSGEEFLEPVYIKMYELIGEGFKKKSRLTAAELMNRFEPGDEQNKAASVFAADINYEDDAIKEKALNEQVRLIKRAYMDYTIEKLKNSGPNDENIKKIQDLALECKKIEHRSYITLLDG